MYDTIGMTSAQQTETPDHNPAISCRSKIFYNRAGTSSVVHNKPAHQRGAQASHCHVKMLQRTAKASSHEHTLYSSWRRAGIGASSDSPQLGMLPLVFMPVRQWGAFGIRLVRLSPSRICQVCVLLFRSRGIRNLFLAFSKWCRLVGLAYPRGRSPHRCIHAGVKPLRYSLVVGLLLYCARAY